MNRIGPRRCPCCKRPEGRGDARGFICGCTWDFCRKCFKCLVCCQCNTTKGPGCDTRSLLGLQVYTAQPDMLELAHNYCHMATNMLELPYGNERRLNDGRRTSSATERAWLELVHAQAARAGISLCAKVESWRGLHHFKNQVANSNKRTGTGENSCVRVVNIFSVVRRISPRIGTSQAKSAVCHYLFAILPCWARYGKRVDREVLSL